MEVYVQSRGIGPEHDYTWVKVTSEGQTRSELKILSEQKVYALIQSEAFSIVLTRWGRRFLLLVTGLRTDRGGDYQGRRVRNSLACIGQYTDESNLRGIAVAALEAELESLLDSAIQFDPELDVGFHTSADIVERLSTLIAKDSKDNKDPRSFIGKNVDQFRHELSIELDEYKLPEREGILVVVTKIKDPAVFKANRVWRGLSSLVEVNESEEKPQPILLLASERQAPTLVLQESEGETKSRGKLTRTQVVQEIENHQKSFLFNLFPVDFTGRNFEGLDLSGLDLRHTRLSRTNLKRANLSSTILDGVDLVEADLSNAVLFNANLIAADLHSSVAIGANFSCARLKYTEFRAADLREADFSSAILNWAYLQKANLQGAKLQRAHLRGANLRGADLRGADLRESDLCEAYYTAIKCDQLTKLPDGFEV